MADVRRAGQRTDDVKSSSTYCWRLEKTAMDFSKCCEIIGPLKGNDNILAVSDIEKADMITQFFPTICTGQWRLTYPCAKN